MVVGQTVKVLLVEDDADDAMLTQRLLERARSWRFAVCRANCMEAACDCLRTQPFDVILLDMSLPDATGLETLARVRAVASSTPIVLLTGCEDDALAVEAIHAGAQDYLVKGSVNGELITRSICYAIERTAAEEALKRYRDRLEDLVGERTASLEATNRHLVEEVAARQRTEVELREAITRLEELDRAKTEFVTNVSHELKTPLAAMTYAVDNLLRGVKGPLHEDVCAYLRMLRDDAQRLRRTVSDILDLGRLEARALVLDMANVPFARFVRQSVRALRLETEGDGARIGVRAPRGVGFARCDPSKMERVILNLLRNAIKFSPPEAAIEVTVQADPAAPDRLCVLIEDQGIGIPPEFIDRVTQRYVRVGEHIDGTGLGLAIAKDIVALHGGQLVIDSPPPGKTVGTRVAICLPRSTPMRVLVVDDDDEVRDLLRDQLAQDGYEVVTTANAADVTGVVRDAGIGVVLLDLIMPGGGVEAISRLKASREARHVPIVVLTGAEIGRATREVLEGFSIPALAKPWEPERLLNCLEESIVGKHYLER